MHMNDVQKSFILKELNTVIILYKEFVWARSTTLHFWIGNNSFIEIVCNGHFGKHFNYTLPLIMVKYYFPSITH